MGMTNPAILVPAPGRPGWSVRIHEGVAGFDVNTLVASYRFPREEWEGTTLSAAMLTAVNAVAHYEAGEDDDYR
jgi:hypothetical protein